MKVSICITTYQHAPYIAQCIESVLAQDMDAEMEVLVGDDASVDGTPAIVTEVARRNPNQVVARLHPCNVGPAENLRSLVAAASGDFIAHLDGDDVWRPEKLSRQTALLQERPDCVAVFSNAGVIDVAGRRLGSFNRGVGPTVEPADLLAEGNFLNHSSLVYRREARDAILGTRGPILDIHWYLRLGALGGLAYLDNELVDYRWRTPGSAIAALARAIQQGHMDAFLEAASLGMPTHALRRGVATYWGRLLISSLAQRRLPEARHWYHRFLAEQRLGVNRLDLLRGALRAVPRAMRSLRSRRSGEGAASVFFPTQ